MKRPDVRIRVN